MTSFLKKAWEELSAEDLDRAKGSFIAFTTGLEEGATLCFVEIRERLFFENRFCLKNFLKISVSDRVWVNIVGIVDWNIIHDTMVLFSQIYSLHNLMFVRKVHSKWQRSDDYYWAWLVILKISFLKDCWEYAGREGREGRIGIGEGQSSLWQVETEGSSFESGQRPRVARGKGAFRASRWGGRSLAEEGYEERPEKVIFYKIVY